MSENRATPSCVIKDKSIFNNLLNNTSTSAMFSRFNYILHLEVLGNTTSRITIIFDLLGCQPMDTYVYHIILHTKDKIAVSDDGFYCTRTQQQQSFFQ